NTSTYVPIGTMWSWPSWWRCPCGEDAVGSAMVRDQVEEREQEDPDDVHEVPVEAGDLHRRVVERPEAALPGPPRHVEDDRDADDHVQRVQPGQAEVEGEEDLGVARGV